MSSQPSQSPATRTGQASAAVPGQRRPRDVFDVLMSRWPMAELLWPTEGAATEEPPTVGLPIRVEELVDNDQLVVRAELPGVDPEQDIEVTLDRGYLTITAERREREEHRSASGYRSEFRYGTFTRRLRLPEGTSPEVVSASYADGVLEVRMPAPASAAGTRTIPVERA